MVVPGPTYRFPKWFSDHLSGVLVPLVLCCALTRLWAFGVQWESALMKTLITVGFLSLMQSMAVAEVLVPNAPAIARTSRIAQDTRPHESNHRLPNDSDIPSTDLTIQRTEVSPTTLHEFIIPGVEKASPSTVIERPPLPRLTRLVTP